VPRRPASCIPFFESLVALIPPWEDEISAPPRLVWVALFVDHLLPPPRNRSCRLDAQNVICLSAVLSFFPYVSVTRSILSFLPKTVVEDRFFLSVAPPRYAYLPPILSTRRGSIDPV